MSFVVPGEPIPQGSMRGYVRKGRVALTSDNPKLRNWRQMIAATAFTKMVGRPMFMGAVMVEATFYIGRPKSVRASEPTKRPDLDKLVRALLDGCTDGGVWGNDAQVTKLSVMKRYADGLSPRVEVTVLS